ncbi:MAG: hypothetical protein V2I33_18610 [Kangiellaceae bacterium]|nr:hypothetical protein [Kangiellaceae bacterium]
MTKGSETGAEHQERSDQALHSLEKYHPGSGNKFEEGNITFCFMETLNALTLWCCRFSNAPLRFFSGGDPQVSGAVAEQFSLEYIVGVAPGSKSSALKKLKK